MTSATVLTILLVTSVLFSAWLFAIYLSWKKIGILEEQRISSWNRGNGKIPSLTNKKFKEETIKVSTHLPLILIVIGSSFFMSVWVRACKGQGQGWPNNTNLNQLKKIDHE